jgi:hypothetical protein
LISVIKICRHSVKTACYIGKRSLVNNINNNNKKNVLFDTLLLVEMRNIGNQLNQDGAVTFKEWKQLKIITKA